MSNDESGSGAISMRQRARWLTADMDTSISLFSRLVGTGDGLLLESAEVDGRWGRYSIIACDMALFVECRDGKMVLDIRDSRFGRLRGLEGQPFVEGLRNLMRQIEIGPPDGMEDLPPITRALYGYLGYGMAALFNPVLQKFMPVSEADCQFALPARILVFDHLYNRLCSLELWSASEAVNAGVGAKGTTPAPESDCETGEQRYKDFVMRIRDALHRGEAIQVVPSARFSIPFQGDPFQIYRRMRSHNPSPYMFYINFPGITLFGSSPEVMVRCTRGQLQLSPIAGTRRRGKDDLEDARLANELHADPKERAEHVMLVDLGRNDLGRIAEPGSVRLERCMEIEKFSHVMHLTSRIGARLAKNADAIDVLAATFPAGTVSGAPKLRAMQIIRDLEGGGRGPYAGCIGWLGLDKDEVSLDMGITIRSMWVREGRLCWQAGGGIVHDSDPEAEWKEVCNKSAIMRMVLREEAEDVPAHR